jgi:hypothetical protein
MTLANMRENGVRSLSVACHLCHHQTVMNVDARSATRSRCSPSARAWCDWTERARA